MVSRLKSQQAAQGILRSKETLTSKTSGPVAGEGGAKVGKSPISLSRYKP